MLLKLLLNFHLSNILMQDLEIHQNNCNYTKSHVKDIYKSTLTLGYILSLECEFALKTMLHKTKEILQRISQCSIFSSNFKTELQKIFFFTYLCYLLPHLSTVVYKHAVFSRRQSCISQPVCFLPSRLPFPFLNRINLKACVIWSAVIC